MIKGPIVQLLADAGNGGAERVAVLLSRGLAEAGAKVYLVIMGDKTTYQEDLQNTSVTIIRMGILKKPPRFYELGRKREITAALHKVLDQIKPAVVHCHLPGTLCLAAPAIQRIGCQCYYTIHGPGELSGEHRGGLKAVWKKIELIRSLRITQPHLAAVSKDLAQEWKNSRCLKLEDIRVMPNPINLQKFQRKSCDRNSLRPGRIAMLGRLISRKNVNVGLQSLNLLNNGSELWVIGEGPERASLEREVVELGIDKFVKFFGLRNDVHELLCEADLLWLLSDSEGQPMAGIEAMALGLPVIGTDVRGLNELISHEKNGLLVPVNHPNAVAAATVRLINDDDLWRKLVAGGFETVEARSLDKVSAQHLEWYEA